MEEIVSKLLFQNWQRKVIALLSAVVIWIFVNQSIIDTKTIPNIPIKIINLPPDKTIIGLLPNGYIKQRITLTLSGSKDVINELELGDLEVHLDASTANSDQWVAQITKKDLVSLNPSIDLRHHIKHLSQHHELIIKISPLITDKVPIHILPPLGNAPDGYQYLDICPDKLSITVSGPKEEIDKLKDKGVKLQFELSHLTAEELDQLQREDVHYPSDEVSFFVPEKWKKIKLPFLQQEIEITDPAAKELRIDFLRKQALPIGSPIPINVFYPVPISDEVNPETLTIAESEIVEFRNEIAFLKTPLYLRNVSQRFLETIRNHIEIVVVAASKLNRDPLHWSVEVIDPQEMEEEFISQTLKEKKESGMPLSHLKKRKEILRKRFKDYMENLSLYKADGRKLELKCLINNSSIIIQTKS